MTEETFREIRRARARREEVEALSSMSGIDLADRDVMEAAWRSGNSADGNGMQDFLNPPDTTLSGAMS